jgi:hypothetical protein
VRLARAEVPEVVVGREEARVDRHAAPLSAASMRTTVDLESRV